jgi:hypothetical protein
MTVMMARTKPMAANPSAKADTLKLRFSICSSCDDQHPTLNNTNTQVHQTTKVVILLLFHVCNVVNG